MAITAPAANAELNDIVTVTANASDNVGIAGVQFLVDGQPSRHRGRPSAVQLRLGHPRRHQRRPHHRRPRPRHRRQPHHHTTTHRQRHQHQLVLQRDPRDRVSSCQPTIEFLPDGRMLVAELAGKVRSSSPVHERRRHTVPRIDERRLGGGAAGCLRHRPRPQLRDQSLLLRLLHARAPPTTIGCRGSPPTPRRRARSTAVSSFSTRIRRTRTPSTTAARSRSATTGSSTSPRASTSPIVVQQLNNPRGKIHRINPDGTVPADNPFHDGAGPNIDSIWAYGLRNPFRAYFDAPTGRLFVGDVGGNDNSTAREEINVGVAGANYGWPHCEGPCTSPCTTPIYFYPHNGRDASITGGFVYRGKPVPASYRGSYFFADYTQNWIRRLTFDASRQCRRACSTSSRPTALSTGRTATSCISPKGPDGALYYVDLGYSDERRHVRREQDPSDPLPHRNQPPTAVAAANPTSGSAPLIVSSRVPARRILRENR